jgi:hypothetical protein
MTQLSDDVLKELMDDCRTYRENWHVWKSNLYSAMLAAHTVFIALCSVVPSDVLLFRIVESFIIITSLIAIAIIINDCYSTIRIYDALGFTPIPQTQIELDKHFNALKSKIEDFDIEARKRKQNGRILRYLLTQNYILIALLALIHIHK